MDAATPFLIDYARKLHDAALNPVTWSQFGKWHNWAFDAIFYDVRRVPPELWDQCTFNKVPERSIVVIKRIHDTRLPNGRTFELLHFGQTSEVDMDQITAVAIAGVGSSALGTVALAVDVADAIGGNVTVAGIVTGEGRRDVVEQGLGGWYVLREANIVRQWVDNLMDMTRLGLDRMLGIPTKLIDQFFQPRVMDTDIPLPESQDIIDFLKNAKKLRLVVGHSKGGLYLANALCRLADDAEWSKPERSRYLEELLGRINIVTLGAVIYPPPMFLPCIHQFIGELDHFGALNSRLRVEKTVIPGVMHHLNTALPMHMDCGKLLQSHFPKLRSERAESGDEDETRQGVRKPIGKVA